uniref:Cysteine-rich DPF motif domain-containing protein 1 n=1 Tax=Culex pipiens TaxID=7175 RepID=A0A8D8F3N0_CULPI
MSAEDKTSQSNTIITFSCELCKWTESCSYFGKQAPFVRNLKFEEDCYVMRDPFCPPPSVKQSSSVEYFIVIGANCRICSRVVCKNLECSFFYANTFCRQCSLSNVTKFPLEIQSRIKKQFRN